MANNARDIERLDPKMAAPADSGDGVEWISYTDPRFTLNGLYWYPNDDHVLRRLPARAEGVVREPVWNLAQHPSGGHIRFISDTPTLKLRITQPEVVMANMCRMGHSGIDLYAGEPGNRVYWHTSRPEPDAYSRGEAYVHTMFENIGQARREFLLYLPVYNRLTDLDIGVTPGSAILPPTPYSHDKPVVFYGTSITQGGCSTRPGNGYVPALGRILNCDVINLGFSGNGKGEPELAELISEIDAAAFVLDYEANAGLELMRKNLRPFAETIRGAHPDTPILILSRPFPSRAYYQPGAGDNTASTTFFHQVAGELDAKYPGTTIAVDGWDLLGPNDDGVHVDGTHLNDHGFLLMADRLAIVLKSLLPVVRSDAS